MATFTEEFYLREKVCVLSEGLSSRLREFVEEFPSGQSGRKLILSIERFIEEIKREVAQTNEVRLLRWFCFLIDELSEYLEALDHAHTAQTPRACVSVLNEICAKLLDDAEILVTPALESNYRIFDEVPRLSELTSLLPPESQQRVLAALPESLYRVRFPRIERENILNHALFGHEFGHPIADEFFEAHETKADYQERLKLAKEELEKGKARATKGKARATGDQEKARVGSAEAVSEIHKRALVEIVSDAVAVYLFGPSALFSAVDLFIREGLDEPPAHDEYYPPTRYRWRFMLTILEREGHLDALKSIAFSSQHATVKEALDSTLDYLQAVVSQDKDRMVLEGNPYTRVAYSWLEQTLPQAIEHARSRCSVMIYDAALIRSEVPALLERLSEGVPPSETGTWPDVRPVDWRSTFVASWLFVLSQGLNHAASYADRRTALQTAHALAAKGVEYIHLQREYAAFKVSQEAK